VFLLGQICFCSLSSIEMSMKHAQSKPRNMIATHRNRERLRLSWIPMANPSAEPTAEPTATSISEATRKRVGPSPIWPLSGRSSKAVVSRLGRRISIPRGKARSPAKSARPCLLISAAGTSSSDTANAGTRLANPADARLLTGDSVEVDQSALTDESLPATRKSGEAGVFGVDYSPG
jgi:hypothetical protein